MAKILLGVPVEVSERKSAAATTTRIVSRQGLRLGLLDNSKGNADALLALLAMGIKRDVNVVSTTERRKPSVSAAAPADVLEELAAQSDLVITAIAD
jgi:hypothetical protein